LRNIKSKLAEFNKVFSKLVFFVIRKIFSIHYGTDHNIYRLIRRVRFKSFLIVIIIGGIYGGVFTPTEAAAVAAVYAFFIALFIYRDMGPMAGRRWLEPETEPRGSAPHIGFSATVYALAFYFVWMMLSFFAFGNSDTVSGADRSLIGLAGGLVVLVAYALWRDPKSNIANLPRFLLASLSVWGRNLGMLGRNSFGSFFHADTRKVMVDSSKTIIMLMFIIVNALLFAHVLTAERIPQAITAVMVDAGFTWFTFLIAVNIILLLGGQFMEPSGLLLIVAPVVFPIAMELGVDPIHLGIIMVVNMEIGMITPPIGLNLFVTSGITGMSLLQVVKAALPFVAVLMVFLVIVTYIEPISTFLPYLLMGPEIVTN
jgi:C4-dicarboxylate transporter DctM subunit